MSRKTKQLLAMLCAVLAMGGILLLLNLPENNTAISADDEEEYTPVSDENDLLVSRSPLDLTRVTMKNLNGTFTVEADSSGDLYIAELEGIPQNVSFLDVVWSSAVSIGFSNEIDLHHMGEQTLASYGLDSPQAEFTTLYADGTGNTVRIGNAISSESDSYFFMLDDDPAIYVTTFDFSFFQGERYWISDDVFRTGYSGDASITSLSIELPKLGEHMVIEPHRSDTAGDPWASYDYIITSPEVCGADNYFMSTLIEELSWLTAYEAVASYPDSDDLASYGLDDPYAVIKLERNGTLHELTLAVHDYNTLYAVADGLPVIWQIDAASNSAIASLSMRTVRSSDVHIRYFDAIESMTVIIDGEETVIRTERRRIDDSSELYEYYSFCNGEPTELSSFKALLEIFNHAAASDYTTGQPEGDQPAVTVIIRYFESLGQPDETITYTENGARRYLCQINGSGTANVTALWLEEFTNGVQTLAAGGKVTP